MDLLIGDLAREGLNRDIAASVLPPEAWTTALNVRYEAGRVRRMGGSSQPWTPSVAPYFHFYAVSPAGVPWWIYFSLTAAYAFDFSTHSNITRAAGAYTAATSNDFFGTMLSGIPVFTTGADAVQYWPAFAGATDLIILPNWNSTWRCKVIRAFGNYLIAGNITKGATAYPHMIKWSDAADPGAVPGSWDETDATVDAGENDLPDTYNGHVKDMLQLGNVLFVYKERSTWSMHRVGGRFIFDFDTFLPTTGLIAPHCVALCNRGTMHACFAEDDIIVHDGNRVIPILTRKFRSELFNRIERDARAQSFVFHHPTKKEVHFCYAETGRTSPNMAVVWNYEEGGQRGVISEKEINYTAAAEGALQAEGVAWADESALAWEDNEEPWDAGKDAVVIAARPAATKSLRIDDPAVLANDGSTFTATVGREGLGIAGRLRNGEWIVDWKSRKLITRIWITLEGGPINVRLGMQEYPEGPTTWATPQPFDPATQDYLDFVLEGPAVAVEFSTTASVDWSLLSYTLEVVISSRF